MTMAPDADAAFTAKVGKNAALKRLLDHAEAAEILRRRKEEERLRNVPKLIGYTLAELQGKTFPSRRPLLTIGDTVVFREAHIGQIFAPRGVGKTWFAQTLALVAATGIPMLGFANVDPCRVLYIDGEMGSDEIQQRFDHLAILFNRHNDLATRNTLFNQLYNDNLVVVAADWQEEYLPRLDTVEGQAAIEPFVDAADLIIPDNRSCLFDPEGEKNPVAWEPTHNWLLSLRRRGKGTILVHHANRQGGARGISNPEDPMDVLMQLEQLADYTPQDGAQFRVDFTKHRHFYGQAAMPFVAKLHPETGWTREAVAIKKEETGDEAAEKAQEYLKARSKLREYLEAVTRADEERPSSFNKVITGAKANRNQGLIVLAEWRDKGVIVKDERGGWRIAPNAPEDM